MYHVDSTIWRRATGVERVEGGADHVLEVWPRRAVRRQAWRIVGQPRKGDARKDGAAVAADVCAHARAANRSSHVFVLLVVVVLLLLVLLLALLLTSVVIVAITAVPIVFVQPCGRLHRLLRERDGLLHAS